MALRRATQWSSAGYTGDSSGYNGTFTIGTIINAYQFTVTDSTGGLTTLTGNASGYAISQNAVGGSALRPTGNQSAQRSMVDSVAYTFTSAVPSTALSFTMGTSTPTVTGNSSGSAPAPATAVPARS